MFAPVYYISRVDKLDRFIKDFNQYLAFDKWQVVRDYAEITFRHAEKNN